MTSASVGHEQSHKSHRSSQSGPTTKKKDKNSKKKSDISEGEQQNPKGFSFSSSGKAKHLQSRATEKEQKRLHVPTIDRSTGEPAPYVILLHGPPKVGKSLLIKCLIKHYTILCNNRPLIQSTKHTTPLLYLPNFTLGCAHTVLAEPVGVAGFCCGILSLPAQLAVFSPTLGNRFSYCLISPSFDTTRLRGPSLLILGRSSDDQSGEFIYSPMLDNPKHPYFYSVALEAVSIAGKRLPATRDLRRIDREGNGRMVVDSGTTFTILPARMYGSLSKEFDLRMKRIMREPPGWRRRWGWGSATTLTTEKRTCQSSCSISGEKASVALPARNYFLGFDREEGGQKRKVGCLMMMNGGDDSDGSGGGPSATLGNFRQQGFEVMYDLERRRVGIARQRCAQLWDTLSRG